MGHIIFKKHPKLAGVVLDDEYGQDLVPHYGLESLVVRSDMHGQGIGQTLVRRACLQIIQNEAPKPISDTPMHNNPRLTLVSAIACRDSVDVFLRQGFTPNNKLASVAPYRGRDFSSEAGKQIVGKVIL